jgi:ABC-type multidrug transport system fused ATPase/permease subunit
MSKTGPRDDAKLAAIRLEWWPRSDWNKWPPSSESARIEENVGGMRVVQAFANEAHERALFAQENELYRRTKLHAYRLMAASTAVTYIGMRLTQIVVMVTVHPPPPQLPLYAAN